jgi:hypothetical protein
MATTVRIPLDLRNPQVSANGGNSFWTVGGLTAWDAGHWEFAKSVQGNIFGVALIPHNLAVTPNASIIVSLAANATTGVAVVQASTSPVANAASFNPASLTAESAQNITMPATAYLRKDVTFTLTNAPAADNILIVEILHNGTNGSETLAANLLLFEAVIQLDLA